MECLKCGNTGEPKEKPPMIILCGNCGRSYDYFQTSEYYNKQKAKRLEAERKEANREVSKSYNLKGKR